MATGAPDWQGLRWKTETVLRPTLTFPSGKVLFVDSFESPTLKWGTSAISGGTASLTTSTVFADTNALKLSVAAQANSSIVVTKLTGLPETKNMGVEVWFNVPSTTDGVFRVSLLYFDGAKSHHAIVQWIDDGEKWQYSNTAGLFDDITNGDQDFDRAANSWQHMKLTAEFNNDEYLALKVNEKTFNLEGISMFSGANVNKPSVNMQIRFRTTTPEANDLFVDSVVLTEE